MSGKKKSVQAGKIYHIYNKGNNGEILFREKVDYEHFLFLMEKYISLIADIYAWVLMNNHFHLLLRVKMENEIKFLKPIATSKDQMDEEKWKSIPEKSLQEYDVTRLIKPQPSRQFSHLFNAYTKYINKKYNRTGSLFQKSFSRKIVWGKAYFKSMVYYIHHNPVHHGFVENMIEYPWSSFLFISSPKESFLNKKQVLDWFDCVDNYDRFHLDNQDIESFKSILFE